RRKAVLGRYERGLATDFEAADRATRVAAEAVEIVHKLGGDSIPARLLDILCAGTPAPEKIRAAAKRLHDSFGAWLHLTQAVRAHLPADVFPGSSQPLEDTALSTLLHYAKDLQAVLNQFGSLTEHLLAHAQAKPADAVTLVEDLKQAQSVLTLETTQQAANAAWGDRFGQPFQGLATDWQTLHKTVTWARRVRDFFAPGQPPE